MADNKLGKFADLLANPVVGAAALNLIDMIVGVVTRQNQGEITEEQALQAFGLASSKVEGAFKGWHAAEQPDESQRR